jgi:hypothetical protein
MRTWAASEIEHLRQLVDLLEDGLLVVDVLREGDSQPAFRTLVQLDGDVLTSISPAALDDPDFTRAHERHLLHVGQQLRAHTDRFRVRIRRLSIVLSGGGGAVAGFGSYSSGLSLQFVDGMWAMFVSGAGGVVVAVVAWPLGRVVLQWLITWRLGHDRRGRTDSALERLKGQLARSTASR